MSKRKINENNLNVLKLINILIHLFQYIIEILLKIIIIF